jgi:pimeloyl-ACP methyl ester carboxylesterase
MFHLFFVSLLFWISFGIVMFFVCFIVSILYILIFPVYILYYYKYDTVYIDSQILVFEESILKAYVKSIPIHFNILISNKGVACLVHILFFKSKGQNSKNVFLVHGTASSSLSFIYLLDDFSETFNVYVIDLPGFGRCHVEGCDSISITYLVNVLKESMDKLYICKAVFIGHSFGGYLCIEFAQSYPSYVDSIILLNPAGIFPSLGYTGAYWAVVFKLSIPNSVRWLKQFGYFLVTDILHFSQESLYWWYIKAHPRGIGDKLVSSKVNLNFFGAYWKYPAFGYFYKLWNIPVCLIYGEEDDIMPAHQGYVVHMIFKHELKLIKGVAHSTLNTPQDAKQVTTIIQNFVKCNRVLLPLKTVNLIQEIHKYESSFDTIKTTNTIDCMYQELGVKLITKVELEKFRFNN